MIFGMELYPPKHWWDLFCSAECCREVHGDKVVETFADAQAFLERTKVDLRTLKTKLACFHCERPLVLINEYEYLLGWNTVVNDVSSSSDPRSTACRIGERCRDRINAAGKPGSPTADRFQGGLDAIDHFLKFGTIERKETLLMQQQFAITIPHYRGEHYTLPEYPDQIQFRSHDLPATEERVVVEVDLEGLANKLGFKAVHSKGGKAVEAGGLVVVRHVRKNGWKDPCRTAAAGEEAKHVD